LAALLSQSGWRRWLATTAIGVMAIGCLRNVTDLYVDGRGRFDNAVRRITASNPAVATVATIPEFSLFDERVKMLLDYYVRSTRRQGRLKYVEESGYPRQGTDWLIREALGNPSGPPTWIDRY